MKVLRYSKEGSAFSRMIAGCMRWGKWGESFNTNQYQEAIENCLELGISSFDHADIYGSFTTEEEFGKALSEMSISRESIQLISKCGIRYPSENRPENTIKSYDYSSEYIIDSVDNSLTNLKTEYLDLLLLHRPSPLLNPEEVAKAFAQLKSKGKVKEFGVSNFNINQVQQLLDYCPLHVNQVELSLSHRDILEDGTVGLLRSAGLFVQAWSPLGGASLFDHKDPGVKRLQQLAKDWSIEYSKLLFLFLLHTPHRISPVIGTTKIERIQMAIECLQTDISDKDWFTILNKYTGTKVP